MIYSRASLEIGFPGNLNGSRYQIIGGGVWTMDYQEYDSEDKRYKASYWRYTEWVLRDEAGKIAYLIEDNEGFAYSQLFDAPYKIIPDISQSQSTDFRNQGNNCHIIEYGTSKLLEFEGQNGYEEPEPAEKYFFLYKDKGKAYSVEMPYKNGNMMLKEREYYEESPLSYSEILTAFKDNPKIKNQRAYISNLKFAHGLSSIVCWIFFIAFIYAFFPEKKIFSHTFELTNGLGVDSTGAPKLDTLVEFYTPLWETKKANEIYLIELAAVFGNMPAGKNPAEMYAQVAIIEENAGVVNQLTGEFWEEFGFDYDGSWREKNNCSSLYLRTEKAGKYSAWLNIERAVPMLEWTAKIDIRVYKYTFLWWYMLIYWLLAITLNVILMGLKAQHK